MAREFHKLTDRYVRSATLKPGRHSDGNGLYLNVSKNGAKSWLFMWKRNDRRREMGLGGFPAVTLARARKRAVECQDAVQEGRDPISEAKQTKEPTFGECADQLIELMESSWRNEKHRAQWRMTLGEYCRPIRQLKVSDVDTHAILKVLKPMWGVKPETASRLRGRIERVLDYAKAKGWREGDNPALWRGHLKNVLPAPRKLSRGHHPAMPYKDIPEFMARLEMSQATAARALEFLILTAGRSGEILGARWDEIDMGNAVWTVPAERMKSEQQHRVPLSARAVALLGPLSEMRVSEFVFPGQRSGRPLSGSSMTMLMRRLKADAWTVHGFRSSFRDWCGEETSFPREVAEEALAHSVGSAVERSYRRGDALNKRRELMQAWTDYVAS